MKVTVTWSRGTARRVPDGADTFTDYYDGDAPVSHPAFRDAVLCGSTWALVRKSPSKRGCEEIGKDKVKHLASWGIKGTYEVTAR